MAFRNLFSKRFSNSYRAPSSPAAAAVTLDHSLPRPTPLLPPNAATAKFQREYLTSPDTPKRGLLRRFLHRKTVTQLPEFLSVPVGDRLREKLSNITGGDRLHLDGIAPPPPPPATKTDSSSTATARGFGITVEEAKKLLRISQLERMKSRLRGIPESSISYKEFVNICHEECGWNKEQGLEFAKLLDQSGNVIVLGDIVFLRPDQVAKTMGNMISKTIASPNDPRRSQLEQMEKQKAVIDQKAKAQVKAELYCGLGFLVAQTLGFMRLTFWELSWDVMEPICFFVTSMHFALAYGFFLRTSTEPSFEGYFQQRFTAKQKKLMQIHNFDAEKYNQLRREFYPDLGYGYPHPGYHHHHKPQRHGEGAFVF
ncbi:hypothetical protein Tsubulata_031328 [Turnera subulata]|uniref:Calcium uniporter protein C-terminal domain-containing protein n=1 Tax=Turnera subulata TaxID=218843 RepID=A0A9Q0G2D2_9ROSI|nr:hypothetical protein Tsubulata_031328 [Turnera subulata]